MALPRGVTFEEAERGGSMDDQARSMLSKRFAAKVRHDGEHQLDAEPDHADKLDHAAGSSTI